MQNTYHIRSKREAFTTNTPLIVTFTSLVPEFPMPDPRYLSTPHVLEWLICPELENTLTKSFGTWRTHGFWLLTGPLWKR